MLREDLIELVTLCWRRLLLLLIPLTVGPVVVVRVNVNAHLVARVWLLVPRRLLVLVVASSQLQHR